MGEEMAYGCRLQRITSREQPGSEAGDGGQLASAGFACLVTKKEKEKKRKKGHTQNPKRTKALQTTDTCRLQNAPRHQKEKETPSIAALGGLPAVAGRCILSPHAWIRGRARCRPAIRHRKCTFKQCALLLGIGRAADGSSVPGAVSERECVLLLALGACIPPSPIAIHHTHITEYATHPALSESGRERASLHISCIWVFRHISLIQQLCILYITHYET